MQRVNSESQHSCNGACCHSSPASSNLSENSEESYEFSSEDVDDQDTTVHADRRSKSPADTNGAYTGNEEVQNIYAANTGTVIRAPQPRRGRSTRSELRCKQCRDRFNSRIELLDHVDSCRPIKVTCNVDGCGKTLNRQADLARHHRSVCVPGLDGSYDKTDISDRFIRD